MSPKYEGVDNPGQYVDMLFKKLAESRTRKDLTVERDIDIGAIVTPDSLDLGYLIAYTREDCPVRLSNQMQAWQLVHGPLVVVSPGMVNANYYQPIERKHLNHIDVLSQIEPWYLGYHPEPLVEHWDHIQYGEIVYFVYPENFVVPKQERMIVDECIQQKIAPKVCIITRSPLICTDFIGEHLLVLRNTSSHMRE